jgi:hypothetical protein
MEAEYIAGLCHAALYLDYLPARVLAAFVDGAHRRGVRMRKSRIESETLRYAH